ncbi:hypothetical protein SDC9_138433 [bioreactor metagenome]|uniref:Uncharacterized protein n=1 Tax=bioreactor metagenome TaxID=1076179 RepID=A0A645DPW7_9ZZZZ
MKKRIIVIVLCVAVMLSGCSPRLISEARAKEAGLAMINRVFDVNETEAAVTLEEQPGLSDINGVHAHLGGEDPIKYYTVKVGLLDDGNFLYYAEVNAQTGVAYRVDRNTASISLSEEQRKQADVLGNLDDFHPDSFLNIQNDAMSIVQGLIQTRLEKDVPIFRMYPDMIESDSVDFPKVWLEYIVVMENDTIYTITLCWPSMDIIGVYNRTSDPF